MLSQSRGGARGGEWWSDPGNMSEVEPVGFAFPYRDRKRKRESQGGL